MDLRVVGNELSQDSTKPEGLLAKRRPDPVVARRRGIPFVEDQIEHLEDGGEPEREPREPPQPLAITVVAFVLGTNTMLPVPRNGPKPPPGLVASRQKFGVL